MHEIYKHLTLHTFLNYFKLGNNMKDSRGINRILRNFQGIAWNLKKYEMHPTESQRIPSRKSFMPYKMFCMNEEKEVK